MAWRARLETTLRKSWVLGALVAVASWNVAFVAPAPGNDGSWVIGLYLATEQGLRFGEQLIFTYGPLGFLSPLAPGSGGVAVTVSDGLSQLAFVYAGAIHLLLCVSLVWALRRTLGSVALAALVTFLLAAGFTAILRPYALAAIWCLALLAGPPSPLTRRLVVFGGGGLAAIESLIRLSSGPVVLAMCAIAVAASPGWRRDLPRLLGTYLAALAALWFATGQALGNVPDFIAASVQIVGGYSQAMASVPPGAKWHLAAIAGALAIAFLAAGAAGSAPSRRARVGAGLLTGLAAFAAFKEGVVREDEPHLGILFATALALALAIPWRPSRRWAGIAGVAALATLAAATATPSFRLSNLNAVDNAGSFGSGLRTLAGAERRHRLADSGRELIEAISPLDPETLALVRGRPLQIDPSGAAVVWAYDLDWRPLPVFWEDSAYTTELDDDNADFLTAPDGPERVLRGSPATVDPFSGQTIDGRNPVWNPPKVNLAFLCDFRVLRTTPRWQLLAPAPNRCGEPRPLGSVRTRFGETVEVPRAGPAEAVFARIHGAGVSGLERLRSFLYRARLRFVEVNGGQATYRLVPGTAADGLIMTVPPALDLPAPFSLSANARTIELTGPSGDLTIDFFALPLRRR